MQLFGGLEGRVEKLEAENAHLFNVTNILAKRLALLEKVLDGQSVTAAAPVAAAPAKPAAKPAKKEESDDDFAFSDDEDDAPAAPKESSMEKMKRMAAEKKAEADAAEAAKGHVGPITKSICVFDVKPWSDETDMKELEACVRSIEQEGLKWSTGELVEIGFGIKKLRIAAQMVDHLVGLYDLEDRITEFDEHVQSVDIFSHNKI